MVVYLGGIFVLTGTLVIIGGARADNYHNLMHLIWGALALGASFMGAPLQNVFALYPAFSIWDWPSLAC